MVNTLIFSPYACRYHQFSYEATIAKACQVRGATVEYLLCDGLLPECDMHWDSFPENSPRPFNLCQSCQTRAIRNLRKLDAPFRDLPYRWLGEFVSKVERENTFLWAQSLSPYEMRQAFFMDYPIGEWVQSSVISYFRQYPPDMNNWRVINVYRGFLFSASIVVIALKNYLEKYPINSALLFNGRQSITRVAFEIFRRFGIRVLTHEIPFYQRGHLLVKPNARCWSIDPFIEFWHKWKYVPLTRPDLENTLCWLKRRRYGTGLSWYAFNSSIVNALSVKKTLNLTQNKPLLALFTSSTDEFAGDPDLQGPYETQSQWVQDVVDWVRNREGVQLVIRVHPNLAGNTGLGKANDEIKFYQQLRSVLPENSRIIMPDEPLNSYVLTDEADIGLTFGSTIGFEMAMLGKPVVLGSRAIYEDLHYIFRINSRQSLSEVMEESLKCFSKREIQREAFRFAYYYIFKFEREFPLVSVRDVMDVKLSYSSAEALAPGLDETLDYICNYLIYSHPLFASPTENQLLRNTEEENVFFEEIERSLDPLRDVIYERWLHRMAVLNKVGRLVQYALMHAPFGTGPILNRLGKAIYLPILNWLSRRT